jgi:hypothetical protein
LRSALDRELLFYGARLFLKHLPSKTIKWNIIQYRYLASIALPSLEFREGAERGYLQRQESVK